MNLLMQKTPIEGVFTIPLAAIPVQGGPVLHLLRPGTIAPCEAGEVYFSEIEPGCVKAWKQHLRMTQRLAVPCGRVLFVVYDDRPESPTCNTVASFVMGRPDNWFFLHLPPLLWYGFKGLGAQPSLVVNCPDMAHDPAESRRLPADAAEIPHVWNTAQDV